MKKTSDIILRVTTDENKIPEAINWSAQDGGVENEEAKAAFLLVWDHKSKESLRMNRPLDQRHAGRRNEAFFS